MASYLIIDVDDLIDYLNAQPNSPKLSDAVVALRNTAALAVGLTSAEALRTVAAADWNKYNNRPSAGEVNVAQVFVAAGFDLFNVTDRRFIVDGLLANYFPADEVSGIEELIICTSRTDLVEMLPRIGLDARTRVRVWSDMDMVNRPGVIFQPLESILGVQSKSVAVYIDFENITISLNEQGYIVDLDMLIEGIKRHAENYGQVVHIAAYAPWGQRGSLPPILDVHGREISDEIPSKLAMESIDPVFSLPGKNSADLRIAKDVLAESSAQNAPEVIIIASGDRDFNDIYNTLRAKGRQVVVWGVRGSTSRVLELNTAITLAYIDDLIQFRNHSDLMSLFPSSSQRASTLSPAIDAEAVPAFRPSQWSSLILQIDYLTANNPRKRLTMGMISKRLDKVNTTVNEDRATDLIEQGINIGILLLEPEDGAISLNDDHPIVEKTRRIRDHIVQRVNNTLTVRQWDYVNYGFLLKGIAMDEDLSQPGVNLDDNWRSEWIDFLVREGMLVRELIPHRHNPDDLVPVIRVPTYDVGVDLSGVSADDDEQLLEDMAYRIVVSVEQFTSFRKFAWCPLGSLHKRLREFDNGSAFQRVVEDLVEQGAIEIREYPNPQSNFMTKGVSINEKSPITRQILQQRNEFIHVLINFYDKRLPISVESLQDTLQMEEHELRRWISIMELENVLNPVPARQGLYSLFRTHHTVSLVAGDSGSEQKQPV